MKTITLRLHEDILTKIEGEADYQGLSVAGWIRTTCRTAIDKLPKREIKVEPSEPSRPRTSAELKEIFGDY